MQISNGTNDGNREKAYLSSFHIDTPSLKSPRLSALNSCDSEIWCFGGLFSAYPQNLTYTSADWLELRKTCDKANFW